MFVKIRFITLLISLSVSANANSCTFICTLFCEGNPIICSETCKKICTQNSQDSKLCVDNDKYIGDKSAISIDPLECISENENGKITINSDCASMYTEHMLDLIINSDPNKAFYRCGAKPKDKNEK